jgi:hypothetical protein
MHTGSTAWKQISTGLSPGTCVRLASGHPPRGTILNGMRGPVRKDVMRAMDTELIGLSHKHVIDMAARCAG